MTKKNHLRVLFWRRSSAQNSDARATENAFVYFRSHRRNQPSSSIGTKSAARNSGACSLSPEPVPVPSPLLLVVVSVIAVCPPRLRLAPVPNAR